MNNNVTPETNPIVGIVVPVAWWFLCAGMGTIYGVTHLTALPIVVCSSLYLFVPPAVAKINHATVNKKWFYYGFLGLSGWASLVISSLVTAIWLISRPVGAANGFAAAHFGWHLYYLWYLIWPGSIFFAIGWFVWRMIQSHNQHKVNEEAAKGSDGTSWVA
ncbi:MAG: hypothetical protein ACYC8W_07745 [Candidatus Tyrphobacter sp.]